MTDNAEAEEPKSSATGLFGVNGMAAMAAAAQIANAAGGTSVMYRLYFNALQNYLRDCNQEAKFSHFTTFPCLVFSRL